MANLLSTLEDHAAPAGGGGGGGGVWERTFHVLQSNADADDEGNPVERY